MKDEEAMRGMRGICLKLEAGGRAVVLAPWVFLSGLQGSRHNSLNWFSLVHIEDKVTKSQRDFSPVWAKVSEDFPLLSQQMFLSLSALLQSCIFKCKSQ